ncbi:Mitochondrial GTPase 1 [Tupaia chinensis]|uniref:Mitochondrial GTPase 1 n=1 Tax=Tupaia chinensis TaxID=246437 RepID=L9L1Q0_TUPCH|nr:Mitochondrial GTPase 1 [Tupaia chinensis]
MRLSVRALCNAARVSWRENFPLSGRDVARWFPGHMAKGLKKMQSSLKLVDCIIEVHDARISFTVQGKPLFESWHVPLSGRNPLFKETLGLRPHLLVLNKMDLADLTEQQVIPMVTELIESSHRYHRGENLDYCIMVVGVPNVGKSSLINSLRRQHLRKGTVLDHLVGEETMADYLLYTLNKQQLFRYVQHYGLAGACDDIERVLKSVAVKLGKTYKVKVLTGTGNVNVIQPNYPAAAQDFLRTFRSGLLGPVMLDSDILQSHSRAKVDP